MMSHSLIDSFEIIIIVVLALGWIGLYCIIRRKKLIITTKAVHDMQVPMILLCVIILLAFLGIASYNSNSYYEISSTEASPTNIFLELSPEISTEKLYDLAAVYEMSVVGPVEKNKYFDYYIMADPLYFSHRETNGILLKVRLSKGDDRLQSAELIIRTSEGTAKCRFSDAGYVLIFRKNALSLPERTYYESAAEAIELAYSYVFPADDTQ